MSTPLTVIITHPHCIAGEAATIEALLDAGADVVHIRKPDWDAEKVAQLIGQVDGQYHQRLCVHYHHPLGHRFALGGMHYSYRDMPAIVSNEHRVSVSCHTMVEATHCIGKCNYLFLSPVFNSISKQGYEAAFNNDELKQYLMTTSSTTPILALGGVSVQTAPMARQLGFKGMALLGSAWVITDRGLDAAASANQLNQIKAAWNQ
ncbi:thiamine-phosphate pyrophosphorylase [Breznakibacter xylanolyticus]|uniref:Thiamine-phosphate pyrophosphorylase n=1 Tax=Breznakibacter xylanolyticus TaxID=990 RepID=A0A2W7NGI3_9BACT|nr:thiamine phosphate synthase [Breznakibacter xylanolyticus]MBN2742754.1 thiamine phosphate synthase [Marinilabiliaceae bacterium]PZX19521.1 thiamine-phosphate pyrophosphorylase [Breznakibacter xylanolyticus]